MISGLAAKIAARQFVVTGELTPPKGTDLSRLFATAEQLRASVDAINITESPRARMSMDARAVCKLLLDRGIETLVQVTSRDRNHEVMTTLTLNLSGAKPGDYVLGVTYHDKTTGKSASFDLPFKVK